MAVLQVEAAMMEARIPSWIEERRPVWSKVITWVGPKPVGVIGSFGDEMVATVMVSFSFELDALIAEAKRMDGLG